VFPRFSEGARIELIGRAEPGNEDSLSLIWDPPFRSDLAFKPMTGLPPGQLSIGSPGQADWIFTDSAMSVHVDKSSSLSWATREMERLQRWFDKSVLGKAARGRPVGSTVYEEDQFVRDYVRAYFDILDRTSVRPTQAALAAELGVSEQTIYRRRKKYRIPLHPPRPESK